MYRCNKNLISIRYSEFFGISMKIGVNGAGRIGRLFIKAALGQLNRVKEDLNRSNTLDVVHINEVSGKVFDVVHLLKYDSTQGSIPNNISVLGDGSISFGGKHMSFSQFSMQREITQKLHKLQTKVSHYLQ